eukprot:jgi/Botrbrau1/7262/Bobra.0318s0001.1
MCNRISSSISVTQAQIVKRRTFGSIAEGFGTLPKASSTIRAALRHLLGSDSRFALRISKKLVRSFLKNKTAHAVKLLARAKTICITSNVQQGSCCSDYHRAVLFWTGDKMGTSRGREIPRRATQTFLVKCFLIGMSFTRTNAVFNSTSAEFSSAFWRAKYVAIRQPGSIPVPRRVRSSPVQGIVKAEGTRFSLNGKPFYFAGTNAYYLALPDFVDYLDIETFFEVSAAYGVTVVRMWGFSNGGWGLEQPIQPEIGVWNEVALKQLDKVVTTAGQYGIRLIIAFANRWDDFGGFKWYVDQVLGPGQPWELFYTDPQVKAAYHNYVTMIVNRVNTISKIPYKQDPVIFAWELANEPSTRDRYDPTGAKIKAWVTESAALIKGLDSVHMVAVGDEGYHRGRTNGVADWLDDGLKGLDYAGNLADPNIDFGTVHLYPESWGFDATDFWLGQNFIVDRANISHSLNKPVILEEIGLEEPDPLMSRNQFLRVYFGYANSADYAGVLVWQAYAWPVRPEDTYNFDWSGDGSFALKQQIADMEMKNRGTYVPSPIPSGGTPAPPFPPSPPPDPCPDILPPTNGTVDCRRHAFYGQGSVGCSAHNYGNEGERGDAVLAFMGMKGSGGCSAGKYENEGEER